MINTKNSSQVIQACFILAETSVSFENIRKKYKPGKFYKFKFFPVISPVNQSISRNKDKNMVKSKSNKMHLEVNNDLELDFNNATISKRNRKASSTPMRRKRKDSKNLKSSRIISKKLNRMTAKKGSSFNSKRRMPPILINGKRVPTKALKMSSGPKISGRKNVSRSRRGASNSRRKASTSRKEAVSSRRKASASRRKVSDSRRKASDARRRGSQSRRRTSDSKRRASDSRRKASDARRRASDSRRNASDARRKLSGRHSMKGLPFVMPSVAKKEAFAAAASSRRKTPKMSSPHPGFSLKIRAKKMPSSGVDKKSRSIRKRVRFAKKGTNGDDKSETIYMPIQQASNGKSAEAIVVKKEENTNAEVDVKKVKN